ncbi:short chain dehydrogenase [Aspergillus heteromorphus CBS 117.55]|uniref:Short chain dehydrogenase n=1 Tax=Aspergillus heteromorphus CBS 117.55 TaxID=1448321 RepID=A0A317WP21_9EURO|nr:short chain dehydrogenase [Aspergillus heteromorphus CBS 117.55]PWY88143.1 short chain dehydrogenase [Aspergillus heteromorphus CBS 117.55]
MTEPKSPLGLQGKVAIVTGSGKTRGIGAAIASLLAQHGVSVVISYVSPSTAVSAAGVAERITTAGGKALVVQADISRPDEARSLVDQTVAAFGKVDILVNNAGTGSPGPVLSASPESMATTFAVNVFGPVYLMQAAVPHMPPHSRVVNIGSVASKLGISGSPLYGASKAAMDALTFAMAMELGRNHGGITINTVSPGPVDTDGLPPQVAEKVHRAMIPMTRVEERTGTVEDVADVVLLLCAEQSRWISGQVISVCEELEIALSLSAKCFHPQNVLD